MFSKVMLYTTGTVARVCGSVTINTEYARLFYLLRIRPVVAQIVYIILIGSTVLKEYCLDSLHLLCTPR